MNIIEIGFLLSIIFILVTFVIIRKIYREFREIAIPEDLTGFSVVHNFTKDKELEDLYIIEKKGLFLDHYNISRNVVKLSSEVFDLANVYALVIALDTILMIKKGKNIIRWQKILDFLVIFTYILIVVGGILSNINTIYIGLILFVLIFLIEVFISIYKIDYQELEDILIKNKKKNIVKILDKYKFKIILLNFRNVATMPYRFLYYWR